MLPQRAYGYSTSVHMTTLPNNLGNDGPRSFNDAVASLVLALKPSEYTDAADSIRKYRTNIYDEWKPHSDNGRRFFLHFGVWGCAHRQYLDDLFWRGHEAVLTAATLTPDCPSDTVRALSPFCEYGNNRSVGRFSEESESDGSGYESCTIL